MMGKKGTRQAGKVVGDAADPQGMTALAMAYLEWGQVHNYSDHTIDHHRRYLNAFILWASARGLTRPADVSKPILERYQRWLYQYRKTNGDLLSFSTQKSYLVPLRSWFKWLAAESAEGFVRVRMEPKSPYSGQPDATEIIAVREAQWAKVTGGTQRSKRRAKFVRKWEGAKWRSILPSSWTS